MQEQRNAEGPKPTALKKPSTCGAQCTPSLALFTGMNCTADGFSPPSRPMTAGGPATVRSSRYASPRQLRVSPTIAASWAGARMRLSYLFLKQSCQAGYFSSRRQLANAIEWLIGVFASRSSGCRDRLVLAVDSTPVPSAASRETASDPHSPSSPTTGNAPPTRGSSGASAYADSAPPTSPHGRSRWPRRSVTSGEVGRELLARWARGGGGLLVCNKGYAVGWFAEAAGALGVTFGPHGAMSSGASCNGFSAWRLARDATITSVNRTPRCSTYRA